MKRSEFMECLDLEKVLFRYYFGSFRSKRRRNFLNKNFLLKDYKQNWQNIIGYMPQVVNLVDDTIYNNIAFSTKNENIDFKKINQCLDIVQLGGFCK